MFRIQMLQMNVRFLFYFHYNIMLINNPNNNNNDNNSILFFLITFVIKHTNLCWLFISHG